MSYYVINASHGNVSTTYARQYSVHSHQLQTQFSKDAKSNFAQANNVATNLVRMGSILSGQSSAPVGAVTI